VNGPRATSQILDTNMARNLPSSVLALLAASVLLSVLGCSKGPSASHSQAPDASVSASANSSVPVPSHSSERQSDEVLGLRGLGPRKRLEFMPFKDGHLLKLVGERDKTNRYASTVMITVNAPALEMGCSGVLLSPRLVLTAGHCLCTLRNESLAQNGTQQVIGRSHCAQRAQVTAILHEWPADSTRPSMKVWEQEGEVRFHPEFELRFSAQESAFTAHADLAVVHLEKPLAHGPPAAALATKEAEAGETLIMAGYGNDPGLEKLFGDRYFKQGKVTRALMAQDGKILYEPRDGHFNTSYRGGPCFREDEKSLWLVGIVGLGTDKEMSCTSTAFYREWLRMELHDNAAMNDVAPAKPEDRDNLYPSTVIVDGAGPQDLCSGVLIHPRLVLTAAHCVCTARDGVLRNRTCLKQTGVTAHVYVKKEGGYEVLTQSRRGAVQPHERFTALLDNRNRVRSSTSDLAVILLEAPLQNVHIGFELATADVQLNEEVTVTGYGFAGSSGSGKRFFGKNIITQKGRTNLDERSDKEISFQVEMQGAHLAPGDSGGPCFIEKGQQRWLVGINAQGDGTISRFTSIYPHLPWLNQQLEKAKKQSL
jgi:V8-like Glu-specific endopeptidase